MFFLYLAIFYIIIYYSIDFVYSLTVPKPIFDQNDKDEEDLEKDFLNNSFKKTYYFTSSYDEENDDIEDDEESYYSYEEDYEDEEEDSFLDSYLRSEWDITSWEYWTFGAGSRED